MTKDPRAHTVTLVPRQTFSWKVVALLASGWLVVLAAVVVLKIRVLTLLLPLIGAIFVGYLIVCTIVLFRQRNR